MKKFLFLILILIFFSGCTTWHKDWASKNGYIKADNCPKLNVPERQPLPHPKVPIFKLVDDDGNQIELNDVVLMNMIIELFGTVEKFQYLVEIYEREYLNAGGKVAPDLTLDQLKELYKKRIGIINNIENNAKSKDSKMITGVHTLTLKEFRDIVKAWNLIQENKN